MTLNAASEKRLVGVKQNLVKVVRRASVLTTQSFQIVQGNRTQAEQNALYAQGRTKPGKIVTWTKNSKHIGGGAVDFAALVAGKISWNEKLYPPIATAFKKAASELGIGIEWGGDWTTKDWGHVQLTGKAPVVAVSTNPSRGMARFQEKHGWPKHHAAAFIARAQQESYLDIRTGVLGDDSTAFGGWQWRLDRQARVKKLAADKGIPATDWNHQIDFVPLELATTEKRAGKLISQADTLEKACAAAMAYCRPRGFKWIDPDIHGWAMTMLGAQAGHGWANTLKNAKALM
jgi:peptidoglycan L-alanyl-D-glutamate endopeptidase CwlK